MMRPLQGLKVIEFEGIGPGPLAGRMLADLGADVVAVVRPHKSALGDPDRPLFEGPLRRGKRIVPLDLKRAQALAEALTLIETADALIEGNRPGVMERLGLGPADCARRNPRLVYGRMTGWGQDGPLAHAAGHDLNYLALSGVLSLAARDGQAPIAPPTVLGDGAGALGLAFGVAAACFAASRSGKGSVIDCSIVDVAASLAGIALSARAPECWTRQARSTTRRSTISTPAPTDAMFPSARSSRSSTRSSSTGSALGTSTRRRNTTAPPGRR